MIDYFLINATGLITQYGQCVIEADLPKGALLGIVPYGATHYVNNEFITIPDIEWITIKALEQRQALLVSSDWTQLPDVSVDKTAWATYRQELRDITQRSGFPITIDWPVAPTS